jgi:hypothetical protein
MKVRQKNLPFCLPQNAYQHAPGGTLVHPGCRSNIGMIVQVAKENDPVMNNKFAIHFQFEGKTYLGRIQPLKSGGGGRMPTNFQVFLNNMYCGEVHRSGIKWESDSPICAIMVDTIGNQIIDWYF